MYLSSQIPLRVNIFLVHMQCREQTIYSPFLSALNVIVVRCIIATYIINLTEQCYNFCFQLSSCILQKLGEKTTFYFDIKTRRKKETSIIIKNVEIVTFFLSHSGRKLCFPVSKLQMTGEKREHKRKKIVQVLNERLFEFNVFTIQIKILSWFRGRGNKD